MKTVKYEVDEEVARRLQDNIECQEACPVNTNCRGYLNLTAERRFNEGYQLARDPNPVAAICGYVCSAPCESDCRRGMVDRPLAIRQVKRFLLDWKMEHGGEVKARRLLPLTGKKVAVIGCGPAGIAAAYETARLGHLVTVYDDLRMEGGTCVSGIPPFRLPQGVVQQDVQRLRDLDVEIILNCFVGRDISMLELKKKFDAIVIAVGAQIPSKLGVPGDTLEGVYPALHFLRKANFGEKVVIGKRVAVVGGGYTAMDSSRTAVRLAGGYVRDDAFPAFRKDEPEMAGVEQATILYRRSREEMVVDEEELSEVEKECIGFEYLVSPVKVHSDDGVHVSGLELVRNKLGDPDDQGRRKPVAVEGSNFILPVNTIIVAIGQMPDLSWIPPELGVQVTKRGLPVVNAQTWMTTAEGIFAAGDFISGPRTIIEAGADGKQCAIGVDAWLRKQPMPEIFVDGTVEVLTDPHIMYEGFDAIPRQEAHKLPVRERNGQFNMVELGLDEEQAVRESMRCYKCNHNIDISKDLCYLCGGCVDMCPENCIEMYSPDQIPADLKAMMDAQKIPIVGGIMAMDDAKCIRCSLCIDRCPVDAITMDRFEIKVRTSTGIEIKESVRG